MTTERFPRRRFNEDRRQEHSTKVVYTDSERFQKNYSVGYAIECARLVLTERRITDILPSTIANLNIKEKITLERLNEISERIVKDNVSHFYAQRKAAA